MVAILIPAVKIFAPQIKEKSEMVVTNLFDHSPDLLIPRGDMVPNQCCFMPVIFNT